MIPYNCDVLKFMFLRAGNVNSSTEILVEKMRRLRQLLTNIIFRTAVVEATEIHKQ